MVFDIFNIILMVVLPFCAIRLVKSVSVLASISPVLLCYACGIILANIPGYPVNEKQVTKILELAVILAIPMLLFNSKIQDWKNLAGKSLLAFVLAIIAVLISVLVFPFLFRDLPDVALMSAMLTGVYIGGTPNMQAISIALEADNNLFIKVNAAEVASGGIYLLLLAAGFRNVVLRILRPYFLHTLGNEAEPIFNDPHGKVKPMDALKNILISLALTALVLLITKMLYGDLKHSIFIMIAISTLSLIASLFPRINGLPGSYPTGEYFLLIFCVGIGLMADFREILSGSLEILLFAGGMLIMIILVHITLCYLFKIDADNMVMSSTATIFGPAFIGQITGILKNKELLVPGMIMSLIGLAIANYLGVMVAQLLAGLM